MKICCRCKQREVERIDDWESSQCPECNDRDIARNSKREEWNHFHSGEPCPKSELE